MTTPADYSNFAYPKWLETIDQCYSADFSSLFLKLDEQLTNRVKERSSKGLYAEVTKLLTSAVERNEEINIGVYLLQSMRTIYGSEVISRKFLRKNKDIALTVIELFKLLNEVVDMIFYQNTFDVLKEKPLFNN